MSTSEGIPDAALRMAYADPVQFGEQLCSVGGEPMDFSGQFRFWKEPLRAVCDPSTERVHVWNMARGVGKTEQGSLAYLFNPVTNPYNDAMYSVPRSDQLSSFIKMKVQRKVEGSRRGHEDNPPFLQTLFRDSEISVKRNELKTPPEASGSILQARSAWGGGKAIQEFHGAFGIADEVFQSRVGSITTPTVAYQIFAPRSFQSYVGSITTRCWERATLRVMDTSILLRLDYDSRVRRRG